MNVQNFSLYPFDSAFDSALLRLSGSITRSDNRLKLRFDLFDDAFSGDRVQSHVLIPLANSPIRKHELWKTTCFEFFLGVQNAPQYWEFNLSPSGDWNVYRFDNYRAGMREESVFTLLPFDVETQSNQISLTIKLDLNIIKANQPLDIGVTAVIEQVDRKISYWAIEHCGKEANFHLRDSFAIKI